jgi:hypothetical protein
MGAAEAASSYAEGCSESIVTMRSAGKLRAAPEHEALGELGVLLGDGKAVESEELRTGAAALLEHEAPSAEPELRLEHDALTGPALLLGDGRTVGSKAEPETGHAVGSKKEPEPSNIFVIDSIRGGEALPCDVATQD